MITRYIIEAIDYFVENPKREYVVCSPDVYPYILILLRSQPTIKVFDTWKYRLPVTKKPYLN